MRHKTMTLTIGIPAYNEEVSIAHTVAEIMKQRRSNFLLKKIIILSDGSTDNTASIVHKLKKSNPLIHFINSKDNKGKLGRLNQLLKLAKTDAFLLLDADIGFTGEHVIEKAVDMMMLDPKALLVSIHQEPLHYKSTFARVLWASFKLWDYTRLSVPGYQSIHNMYNAASLLRGDFARSLRYPDETNCERAYMYFTAKRRDGFRYLRDAAIVYWPPTTFSEWISMAERPFGKPEKVLKDMFGEDIYDEYKIPRKYVILGMLKSLLHDPFYTPMAILMGFVIGKASKNKELVKNGKYKVSTKLSIP